MKSIAALLLTIALALFPLSGSRGMASMGAHVHAVAQDESDHGHAAVHHRGSSGDHGEATAVHDHAAMDDLGQHDASESSCAGDHGASSCCSLSCHAMAPHVGVSVPAQMHVAILVGLVALPLPSGVGFDGLLRPPRRA